MHRITQKQRTVKACVSVFMKQKLPLLVLLLLSTSIYFMANTSYFQNQVRYQRATFTSYCLSSLAVHTFAEQYMVACKELVL